MKALTFANNNLIEEAKKCIGVAETREWKINQKLLIGILDYSIRKDGNDKTKPKKPKEEVLRAKKVTRKKRQDKMKNLEKSRKSQKVKAIIERNEEKKKQNKTGTIKKKIDLFFKMILRPKSRD